MGKLIKLAPVYLRSEEYTAIVSALEGRIAVFQKRIKTMPDMSPEMKSLDLKLLENAAIALGKMEALWNAAKDLK